MIFVIVAVAIGVAIAYTFVRLTKSRITASPRQSIYRKEQFMQTITPFLWFNDNAEQAVNFYHSVFKNSAIHNILRVGDAGPGPAGSVLTVEFAINGQRFIALNGGPNYTQTPAVSFMINCDTQEEIDELWEKLSEGGEELACGWVTDKYGVTWQVTPRALLEMISDSDPVKSANVMKAMMEMVKLDLPALRRAYDRE